MYSRHAQADLLARLNSGGPRPLPRLPLPIPFPAFLHAAKNAGNAAASPQFDPRFGFPPVSAAAVAAAAAAAARQQQQQQHQSHQVPHPTIPRPQPPPPTTTRPPSSILPNPLGLTSPGESATPGVGLPRLPDMSQVSPGNGNGGGGGGGTGPHLPYSEEPMSPNGECARTSSVGMQSMMTSEYSSYESLSLSSLQQIPRATRRRGGVPERTSRNGSSKSWSGSSCRVTTPTSSCERRWR